MKTLYYIDTTPYQYLVGQASQTVNKSVVIKNIDQMLRVCDIMIEFYLNTNKPLAPKQKKLLLDDAALIFGIASSHLVIAGTDEARSKNKRFWDGLKKRDYVLYKEMHNRILGFLVSMNNPVAK